LASDRMRCDPDGHTGEDSGLLARE
jgi:hypothetical protein